MWIHSGRASTRQGGYERAAGLPPAGLAATTAAAAFAGLPAGARRVAAFESAAMLVSWGRSIGDRRERGEDTSAHTPVCEIDPNRRPPLSACASQSRAIPHPTRPGGNPVKATGIPANLNWNDDSVGQFSRPPAFPRSRGCSDRPSHSPGKPLV